MISSDFILILLLSSLAFAPLVHLVIAYWVAPKRAKAALLDALVHDDLFQTELIGTIVKNLLRPVKFKLPDGSESEMPAIDPVLKRAMTGFTDWLHGQQGKMAQTITQSAQAQNQALAVGQNPLVSIALAQIPKKYQWIIPLLMGKVGNQEENINYPSPYDH
jgi:hypothetical protein